MLWFASAGSGLDCYDPTQHKFTNYDTKNSQLISDCIYKVCETKDNELLIIRIPDSHASTTRLKK